jgi:hypothetical protein
MSFFSYISQYTGVSVNISKPWCKATEEAWGVEKQDLDAAPRQHTCSHVAPHLWIFGAARDDCHPPTTLLSRFGPCRLFFVPKIKIHSERSLISDDRRARRKFATGPMCYPAKRVPGRVPELEKTLEAVYRLWRVVLWRGEVLLSCKLINKCFKKKVPFPLDRPRMCRSSSGILKNYKPSC